MIIKGLFEEIDLLGVVPVWNWNGYNRQWVESGLSREDAIQHAISELEERRTNGTIEVIEDDEFLTIVVRDEYDFHGWRETFDLYTTRVCRVDNGDDEYEVEAAPERLADERRNFDAEISDEYEEYEDDDTEVQLGESTLAKLRDSKLFEEDDDEAEPVGLIPRESDMDALIRLNAEVNALRVENNTLRSIINTASEARRTDIYTVVMCPSAGWVEFYAGFVDPAHDTGLHIWAAGDLASMAKIYLKWQDEVERDEHRQHG